MTLFAGKYEPVEILGEGAWGKVVLARDQELDRFVAVKILKQIGGDPALLERFRREARNTARLAHPNVVEVLDFGVAENRQAYIVYEYVEGTDLDGVIKTGRRPELSTVLGWARDIASALAAAHRAGLLHRDVKPANVLLREDGRPLLADFGLAKAEEGDETLTRTGQMPGTPAFLAPEVWKGFLHDERTDQFAWAATFFELAYGRRVYPASTYEELIGLIRDGWVAAFPPSAPGEPPELREVLARALAADPGERFASMQEVVEALAPSVPVPEEPRPAPSYPLWRRGLLGLLVLSGVLWLLPAATDPEVAPAPGPESEEVLELRKGIERGLDRLLTGHRDAEGRHPTRDEAHLTRVQGALLDSRTPLMAKRVLESLERWLALQPDREHRGEKARSLLSRVRRELVLHLMNDYEELDARADQGFRRTLLGTGNRDGDVGRRSRQRYGEMKRFFRGSLATLEEQHPAPPVPLFQLLVLLVDKADPTRAGAYLTEAHRRLESSEDPGGRLRYVEQIGKLQQCMRQEQLFQPPLLASFRRCVELLEEPDRLPDPAVRTRMAGDVLKNWSSALEKAPELELFREWELLDRLLGLLEATPREHDATLRRALQDSLESLPVLREDSEHALSPRVARMRALLGTRRQEDAAPWAMDPKPAEKKAEEEDVGGGETTLPAVREARPLDVADVGRGFFWGGETWLCFYPLGLLAESRLGTPFSAFLGPMLLASWALGTLSPWLVRLRLRGARWVLPVALVSGAGAQYLWRFVGRKPVILPVIFLAITLLSWAVLAWWAGTELEERLARPPPSASLQVLRDGLLFLVLFSLGGAGRNPVGERADLIPLLVLSGFYLVWLPRLTGRTLEDPPEHIRLPVLMD